MQDAGLLAQGGVFGCPTVCGKTRHEADLELTGGFGFDFGHAFGSGLGLGLSGSTCKVEPDEKRIAHSIA